MIKIIDFYLKCMSKCRTPKYMRGKIINFAAFYFRWFTRGKFYTKIGFEIVINSAKRLHSSVVYSERHGSAVSEEELLFVLRNRCFCSKR
jgi:hypothetical protein